MSMTREIQLQKIEARDKEGKLLGYLAYTTGPFSAVTCKLTKQGRTFSKNKAKAMLGVIKNIQVCYTDDRQTYYPRTDGTTFKMVDA